MRILFVNLQPYLPQMIGGVETSTLQLGTRLKGLGHEVAVMSGLRDSGTVWWWNVIKRRLTGKRFPCDRLAGVPVYRGHRHASGLVEVIDDFKPDSLVVSGGTDGTLDLATVCAATGLPTFHYFHDLASVRRLAEKPDLAGIRFFANSHYTASHVRDLLGVSSTVLPPLIEPSLYRTSSSRQHVTMVNPRQIKGGKIALQLAERCPDIPFVFVEAWSDGDPFVAELRHSLAVLKNVRWMRPREDMKPIYASTRILLVPSQWEETWGRVVSEAHVSGIPVLASSGAALPESVGPGGVLVERNAPIEAWQNALVRMWESVDYYERLCQAARQYSEREQILPEFIVRKFLDCLTEAPPLPVQSAELPYQTAQGFER